MKYILRNNISIFNSYGLIIILSVLIFTFPRYFQLWKGALIFLLLLLGFINKLRVGTLKIDLFIFNWFFAYLCFALIWSVIGFINKNPGVSDSFRLEFGWTLIIFILVCFTAVNSSHIKGTLYIVSFVSSLVGLYYILMPTFGKLSLLAWIPFEEVHVIDGLIRTALPNIGLMSFLLPSLIFMDLPRKRTYKYIALSAIIVSIMFVLMAGRRIVQIVFLIAILFYFIENINRIKVKFLVLFILTTFILTFLFISLNTKYSFIDFSVYYDLYIERLFTNYKDDTRYRQVSEFWKYTKQDPLIGVGFGKGIPSIVRDINQPWRYELTYSLYLYQTGLIGLSLLLGLWSSLLFRLRRSSNIGKALSIGLFCYLIASGTNPYLTSGFDYKFPILIIMLFISFDAKFSNPRNGI